MSDRKFGIEIEHGNPQGYDYVRSELKKAGFVKWDNVGCDGSGVEVRSPILKGEKGFEELKEVMDCLISIGGYTTGSDGGHIHHDAAPEFLGTRGIQRCIMLFESWQNNKDNILPLVAERRHTRWSWTPEAIDTIKRTKHIETSRRGIHLSHHNSFEIRLLEGTLDYERVKAWILFGQHFIDKVAERKAHPLATCKDSKHLLAACGLSVEAQTELLKKRRKKHPTDRF